jgi:uncharacterized protein YlzI (FlbEa/FlbD family)
MLTKTLKLKLVRKQIVGESIRNVIKKIEKKSMDIIFFNDRSSDFRYCFSH